MKRITKHVLISAIALCITAGVVFAASVHFKNSPKVTATRSADKLTLSVSGALTGLGNETLRVSITANANPSAVCINPAGEAQPPGQQPAAVTVTGSQVFTPDQIKNGNLSFTVQTGAPAQPTDSKASGCPGDNWTARIICMAFTGYTLTVEQPLGTTVLQAPFSVSGSASSCP